MAIEGFWGHYATLFPDLNLSGKRVTSVVAHRTKSGFALGGLIRGDTEGEDAHGKTGHRHHYSDDDDDDDEAYDFESQDDGSLEAGLDGAQADDCDVDASEDYCGDREVLQARLAFIRQQLADNREL